MPAQRKDLGDGRWHFSHGPMDVILKVEGAPHAVLAAVESAWARFEVLLAELVAELPMLRQPVQLGLRPEKSNLMGITARQMYQACYPFCDSFITPMAAVAGAVAQDLISRCQGVGVTRAWANNGGDIALHLAPGQSVQVGLYADLGRLGSPVAGEALALDGRFRVQSDMSVRGIATSGWRGRSLSMGIADSVTVLASSAATADAAATLIANAVNVRHPDIERLPANQCRDDSDLAERLVTVDVPVLPAVAVDQALVNGLSVAQAMQDAGLIFAAVLVCQRQIRRTHFPSVLPLELRAEPESNASAVPLVLASVY